MATVTDLYLAFRQSLLNHNSFVVQAMELTVLAARGGVENLTVDGITTCLENLEKSEKVLTQAIQCLKIVRSKMIRMGEEDESGGDGDPRDSDSGDGSGLL